MTKAQVDPTQHVVNPVTHEVTLLSGHVVGVLEGDPNDYQQMRVDLSHISSIRGLLGQCVAQMSEIWDQQQDDTEKVYAELFLDYADQVRSGRISGKNTDEMLKSHVRRDSKYAQARDLERRAKREFCRFANLRDDLQNLENSMKKILEYGKDQ